MKKVYQKTCLLALTQNIMFLDPNNTSKVPWNIGIYKDQNLVCGGTLISEKVIVTAAHCFTSEVQSIIDPAPYKAGAGKYHSDFKTVDDPEGQMMQVSEIQVPRRYKGPGKTGDIATVIIEGNFVLAPNIVPACFEFDNHGPMYPNNNTIALVSGWSGSQVSSFEIDLRSLFHYFKRKARCSSLPSCRS